MQPKEPLDLSSLPPDGGENYNRLIFSKSPYLLQHAHQDVDWFEWGPEAFEKAKLEDKPIFLSIGYSTCHWCHVMAHESFDDTEIAQLLNSQFVSIKVDREERPDIDRVYMEVCQAMTGQGGWPLTAILDHEKKPWFCGTYFSPSPRQNQHGMTSLLPLLVDFWKNRREKVLAAANELLSELAKRQVSAGLELKPYEGRRGLALQQYEKRFDSKAGGFGSRPKFPSAFQYLFLLSGSSLPGSTTASMTEHSLTAMRLGGIWDHVGGGFHRYSTDSEWLLPHFEKMLYDQAFLLMAYAEASIFFKETLFQETAEAIVHYVKRDLSNHQGGFYSAEDADSEGEEGKFYVWQVEEIRENDSSALTETFIKDFQFSPQGNFVEEHSGRLLGQNIPHLQRVLSAEERKLYQPYLFKLEALRATRIRPSLDDKVLTDWNGMWAAALFRSARQLGNLNWLELGAQCLEYIYAFLRDEGTGQLKKRLRGKEAGLVAHLDDYAYVLWALWEQVQSLPTAKAEKRLKDMLQLIKELFWDEDQGLYRFSPPESEKLPLEKNDFYDGATPAGNNVMAFVLASVGHYYGKDSYLSEARRIFQAAGESYEQSPSYHAFLLYAETILETPCQEVVFVNFTEESLPAWIHHVSEHYHPNRVIRNLATYQASYLPEYMQAMKAKTEPCVFVCERQVCYEVQTTKEGLTGLLKKIK